MSSTYLIHAYPTGYTLSGLYDTVTIGATASVGGAGVVANIAATIDNLGTVDGSTGDGIALDSGGFVTNDALIEATATNGVGVYLDAGGRVFNTATGALIDGGYDGVAVRNGLGTAINAGTISGTTYAGVALGSGGMVTNGGTGDTTALIEGPSGIVVVNAAGTVTNYGTITNTAGLHAAVGLQAGGTVVNGSAADTVALLHGYLGVSDLGTKAGSVTNFGTITGGFAGVEFFGPTGSVTNGSTSDTAASISGAFGVDLFNGGTLKNFGTIKGGAGVNLPAGVQIDSGTITNGGTGDTSALIEGGSGIRASGAIGPDTIANFGTIDGFTDAVVNANGTYVSEAIYFRADASGTITNEAGALIEDTGSLGIGVELAGTGTVVNYGTITSTTGDSVLFKSASDVLAVHAGAAFTGTAEGDGGTLRFAGTGGTAAGLGSGTLSGSVSGVFSDFATYAVGSLANWTLTGSSTVASGVALDVEGTLTVASGGSLVSSGLISVDGGDLVSDGSLSGTIDVAGGGTVKIVGAASATTIDFTGPGKLAFGSQTGVSVDGFSAGDTISLQSVAWSATNTVTYSASLHEIIVHNASNAVLQTIDATDVTGTPTLQQDGPTTDVVVCFLRGTRIMTEAGEVAVEDLPPGVRVVTLSGNGPALKPVEWIGRRRLDAGRHARPDDVYPIRITAGALGEGLPHRDLLVSPGHALYVEGVLIPANRLIDGHAVFQDRTISDVEYFHIELEQHDILLAEGLPAESYLDSGNRRFFENGAAVSLHAGPDAEPVPATRCVRLINSGPEVTAVRRAMAERQASVTAELVRRSGSRRVPPRAVEKH